MSDFTKQSNDSESLSDSQSPDENASRANTDDVDLSVLLSFGEVQGEDESDLIVELIDLYLDEFPEQLSAMKDSIRQADEISLKHAAHNLKGSSANLGVNGIAAICEAMEQTEASESLQAFNVFIARLEETFEQVSRIFLAERQRRI